ncbi:NUDIX domain-containing protein [Solibacillus sp. CAU 1738]|uniref:NUDIX domain-containing protein n=1 Tax=Solibacillus sp. CAU 1738 TaxID=3140363 RepID=UPI003260D545
MTYPIRVRASALIIQNNCVLLVEFNDEKGLHYNLPGGGVEEGETLIEAVKREAREEASVEVNVGNVAFLYEYAPQTVNSKYGTVHSLTTIFECTLKHAEEARLPLIPDENQTGVKWIHLDDLHEIILYPNLCEKIRNYVENKQNIALIEDQYLQDYEK